MVRNRGVFEGKRYLSDAAVTEMTRKQTGGALPEGYGLGWSTNGGVFGHGRACATNMSIDSTNGERSRTAWSVVVGRAAKKAAYSLSQRHRGLPRV